MATESLLSEYHTNIAHTSYVASLALNLFDGIQQKVQLPAKARDLVEIGALLHDVGMHTDPTNHHIVGRDIVLSTELSGLDDEQRAIVACMVAFHRKKVRPGLEPSYVRLGRKHQDMALRLAGLLRVADGLDYSHTQSTRIKACKLKNGTVQIDLEGPHADEDGARAMKKADLLQKALQCKVLVASGSVGKKPEDQNEKKPAATGVQPVRISERGASFVVGRLSNDDTMMELGRRLMRTHLQKFLDNERKADDDGDIEIVHDMRVSIRRMRALMPVIEAVAPAKPARRFRKDLKSLARVLGPVRDCDVFLDQVQGYIDGLPPEQRDRMKPLTAALIRDRSKARRRMLAELESKSHETFKRDFAVFLTDDAEGWDTRLRIRDTLGSTLWQRYEEVRAYETRINLDDLASTDETVLHDLRIAGKRLRYVLELLADHQEELFSTLNKTLTRLQESLGVLQDIVVARNYVAGLEASERERAALDAYMTSREAERHQHLKALPGLWQEIVQPDYRRNLMELIVTL